MAMTDKTASGILNANYVSVSTAYHKALDVDGYHSIGVGFQGTYGNQSLDGTRLTFEDGLQLDGTWLRSPTEAINSQYVSVHFFDANLGLLYNASTNGNNNFYVGASAYHLNHPKVSFLGVDTINIPTRVTLHGGGFFPVAGSPSTIYVSGLASQQAGARQYVLGGAWAIAASTDETNPVNFYAGLWGRFTSNTTDALIPMWDWTIVISALASPMTSTSRASRRRRKAEAVSRSRSSISRRKVVGPTAFLVRGSSGIGRLRQPPFTIYWPSADRAVRGLWAHSHKDFPL